MSSWSCPHDAEGVCQLVRGARCEPGMRGCILHGRYRFLQDELRGGSLVVVGHATQLQERFYAITTPHRHRIDVLERLMTPSPDDATTEPPSGPR